MSPLPGSPTGLPWRGRPVSRAFLYVSIWIHGKGAPPGSPNKAPVERDTPFTEPSFHYLSQFPVKGPPPHVAQRCADGERRPSTEPTSRPLKIRLSLRVRGKGAPSMFPNRVPMERYSVSRATGLSIYVCQSLQKGALLQSGNKHTATIHGAPRGRKAYIQWGVAWFPKGIVKDTAITSPVPCCPWHDTFHLGLGRPEPR